MTIDHSYLAVAHWTLNWALEIQQGENSARELFAAPFPGTHSRRSAGKRASSLRPSACVPCPSPL